jgi:hypothetical protein
MADRAAGYSINRNDDEETFRYRVLAVMLDAVPSGTSFDHQLPERISRVLGGEVRPIVSENFTFNCHGTSSEIDFLLSGQLDYGSVIGLENIGSRFRYRTTEQTHNVASETRSLGLVSEEDARFLESLGRRLLDGE